MLPIKQFTCLWPEKKSDPKMASTLPALNFDVKDAPRNGRPITGKAYKSIAEAETIKKQNVYNQMTLNYLR